MIKRNETINIEVAYATREKQIIIALTVLKGTSMYEAVLQSNIEKKFNDLDLARSQMGIFGKLEFLPKQKIVEEGDRIEIYRPLKIDPKEARKERAKKSLLTRE